MTSAYITKGTRITYCITEASMPSLAGVQMKFQLAVASGEGTVRNIWAKDPHGTKDLVFNTEKDDGTFIIVPASCVTGTIT